MEEKSPTVVSIQDNTANPAPLGLLAFGMTTVLLNLHNSGLFELSSMIVGMGLFYGGIGQVIAGIEEWKKKNTFGATAFTSYGIFWLSLVALWVMPKMGWAEPTSNTALVFYLVMWGIFTTCMFIGTLKLTRTLRFVFGSLALLFFLLALGDATGSPAIKTFAGIEGVICGLSAIYTAIGQVLNEVYKKQVLPL